MATENFPMSPSESIDRLEVIFTDPFVERVLVLVRQYNAIFKENDPTHDEKNQIVTELDNEWGTINKDTINVTGNVRVRTSQEEDGVIHFLDDEAIISNGFTIVDDPLYLDGEMVRQNSRVVYHFYVPAEIIGIDDEEVGVVYGGTAEIDALYMDFQRASMERAVPWLTYTVPELIEDIDTRLFSVNGTEADAVRSLRGFTLPANFDDESELTKNSLVHYLNEVIEFDTLLPYEISVKGDLYAAKQDTNELIKLRTKIRKALVYISAVSYLRDEESSSDSNLRLVLNGLMLGEGKNDQNATVRVPLDSLRRLKSVRSRYSTED